jgi:plasmid stabilization system protein ParE
LTHRVIVRPLAEADIAEARTWYDDQQPGLGATFADALALTVWRIAESPLSFPRVHDETRRARVRRFAYAVYYRVHLGDVVIVAVAHNSRHPDRWRSRL